MRRANALDLCFPVGKMSLREYLNCSHRLTSALARHAQASFEPSGSSEGGHVEGGVLPLFSCVGSKCKRER